MRSSLNTIPYSNTLEKRDGTTSARSYGVDHQCVAFVMADGIPIPGRRHARRLRLIHAHVADFMIVGIQQGDLARPRS
jgi:hypothetical protein